MLTAERVKFPPAHLRPSKTPAGLRHENRTFLNWLDRQEKNLDFYFFIHYCYNKRYSFLETGKKSKDILPFEFLNIHQKTLVFFQGIHLAGRYNIEA